MSPVSRRFVLTGAALTTASLLVPITVRAGRAAESYEAGGDGFGALVLLFEFVEDAEVFLAASADADEADADAIIGAENTAVGSCG